MLQLDGNCFVRLQLEFASRVCGCREVNERGVRIRVRIRVRVRVNPFLSRVCGCREVNERGVVFIIYFLPS